MKFPLACVLMLAPVLMVGCNQGTPGGAGPIDPSTRRNSVVQNDDTFNLSAPLMTTAIKQGERLSVTIGVKRGKSFDEDVKLAFSMLPTGVSVDPSSPTIKHGDEETHVTLIARKDAALGDFGIMVTGHPKKGVDAVVNLKIKVETP